MKDVIEIQIALEKEEQSYHVYAMSWSVCQDQASYHWTTVKGPATLEGTKAHAKREAFETAYLWQSHAAPDCKVTWNFPGAAPSV